MTLFDSSHSGTCTAAEVASFEPGHASELAGMGLFALRRLQSLGVVMYRSVAVVLPGSQEVTIVRLLDVLLRAMAFS